MDALGIMTRHWRAVLRLVLVGIGVFAFVVGGVWAVRRLKPLANATKQIEVHIEDARHLQNEVDRLRGDLAREHAAMVALTVARETDQQRWRAEVTACGLEVATLAQAVIAMAQERRR